MKLSYLEEPVLEFGAGRHVGIRFGIMNYGPLDFESPIAPKHINVGMVGTSETIDGVSKWLDRCRNGVPAKPNKQEPDKPNRQPNLFARLPGFTPHAGFRSSLVVQDSLCRTLLKNNLDAITNLSNRNERIVRSVDLFMEEIRYLAQNTPSPVIICALPISLLEAMGPEDTADDLDEGAEDAIEAQLDFHDMLKAGAMQQYRRPIQIVLPSTYESTKVRQQAKLKLGRDLQYEATRAWNIHTALYYKAGGIPWRLPPASTELTVCYVGVSFYRALDGQVLLTSVAQVFNERGEGVVVRGGHATISKDDRQAHLPEEHAYDLLKNALARYYETHKTFPARIVIPSLGRYEGWKQTGMLRCARREQA
jgi:hypothetical protein